MERIKMFRIAICDDDAVERKDIEDNLLVYSSKHPQRAMKIEVYSSGFDMLESFDKTGSPDVALLDICMPGMLGTELAHEILSRSEKTNIIFLTTSSDFAVDAFSLHVSDYIKKPYTQEKFDAALDRVLSLRERKTWILLSSEGRLNRIALEDILYIETIDKKKVFALSSGKKLTSWLSVKEVEELVLGKKGFVKCGGSFIVNLSHVRSLSQGLVMDDGSVIPIPRRLRTFLKGAYVDYYLKEAGETC